MQFRWISNLSHVSCCTQPAVGITNARVELIHSSGGGRPKIKISVDQVEVLRSAGYTWDEVASAVLVSRTTIWRRCQEAGIQPSRFTDISDISLDDLVRDFHHRYPHSGQAMLQGYLYGIGVYVQRYHVRASVARVDPLGSCLHRRQPVVFLGPIHCGTSMDIIV